MQSHAQANPAAACGGGLAVNYGDFATSADAEAFGAAALDMEPEAYYQRLCALVAPVA